MSYRKRLLKEYSELNDRTKKLDNFLNNKKVELTLKQEELMKKQVECMKKYLEILEERILLEMGDMDV